MAGQNSINTNIGAMVALRNMNVVTTELNKVQDRVSTGLKVIGAKDDASSFAIAQGLRAEIKAVSAVQQGLANGRGLGAVSLAAATDISNVMADLKKKAIEGMNPANTVDQQGILNADYAGLVQQILNVVQNADFNGRNLLEATSTNVNVIADTLGGTMTLRAQLLQTTVYAALNAVNLANTVNATATLAVVNTAINTVNTSLGQLGADSRAIEAQENFLGAISDALEEGLGSIVDADLAKESARLQALQVKQQLAVQALSIANGAPQVLLSLFRN